MYLPTLKHVILKPAPFGLLQCESRSFDCGEMMNDYWEMEAIVCFGRNP